MFRKDARHFAYRPTPREMTKPVVDRLEVVEVQEQQRQIRATPVSGRDFFFDAEMELAAVIKSRQVIKT